MKITRLLVVVSMVLCAACSTVAPGPSVAPGSSTTLPTFGSPPVAQTSAPSDTVPSVAVPTETPTQEPTAPPTHKPKPPKTPKPTRTPSPTPIGIDLSIFIETADIPNPWYAETTYTIPIHVAVAVADVPNAHVEVPPFVEFDTGPIATTDDYIHNTDLTLYDAGPYDLLLSVKPPPGYVDTYKVNNKVTIHIEVLPKP